MAKQFQDDMSWLFGDKPAETVVDPTQPVDKSEMVKNYLMNKYQPELDKANASVKPTSTASKALQAFGSVLSREDPTKALDAVAKRDDEERQRAIAPINEKIKMDQMFQTDDEHRTKFGQEQVQYKDEHDPDSEISKSYQAFVKKITGLDQAGKSMADLKTLSPMLEKLYDADQKSKDRALTRETNQNNKDIANTTKQKNSDEKTFNDAFQTSLGVKRGSSSGLYGLALKNEAFAQNGLRNIDMIKNGKIKGNENVAAELAADLNRLLSGGGQGADAGIKRLIPESLWGSAQSIKEYILGKPQQFLTDDFLTQMEHQFQGQTQFWGDEKNKVTGGLEVQLEPIFERNPEMKERWTRYWTKQEEGEGGPGGNNTKQYSADVTSYAKEHNITPAQAQSIKDQREAKALGGR